MLRVLRNHWALLICLLLWLVIAVATIQPGKVVIGNDNFSPELDPLLTVSRILHNPAWRTYRALGIPSDSEQADLYRSLVYTVLSPIIPAWLLSQGYLLASLFIGCLSVGKLTQQYVSSKKKHQLALLVGFISYLSSLITIWVYFYPVHLFVAAYAFLPFVLWRLAEAMTQPSRVNKMLLLISTLSLSTSALTTTMFITSLSVISVIWFTQVLTIKPKIIHAIIPLLIIVLPHLFWIPGFALYTKTNADDLQNSPINREITATTVENETKFNTAFNTARYYFSWLDIKENGVDYTYPYRDWFNSHHVSRTFSILPILLSAIALFLAILKRRLSIVMLFLCAFTGWLLIKGANPPLQQLFVWLQQTVPLFKQVFRWQSSKFWPLMAVIIPVLVAYTFVQLKPTKKTAKIIFAVLSSIFIATQLVYIFPLFTGHLIRKDIFVQIPQEYGELAQYLKQNKPQERMLVLPEANTRYFRSYQWGFWGSVVLNYLFPNPLIEKALIIGSDESQAAFDTLIELLYSGNQELFLKGLQTYQTSLILLDKSADDGKIGRYFSYAYDWDVYKKMLSSNLDFTKIWESTNLILYEISTDAPSSAKAIKTDSSADYQKPLITQLGSDSSFAHELGATQVLSLFHSNVDQQKSNLVAPLPQILNEQNFSLTYSSALLASSPITMQLDKEALLVSPAVPLVTQLKKSEQNESVLPQISIPIPPNTHALAINSDVIKRNVPHHSLTSFDTFTQAQILSFDASAIQYDVPSLLAEKSLTDCANGTPNQGSISQTESTTHIMLPAQQKSCLSTDVTLENNSLLSIELTAATNGPTIPATLCLHSQYENRCLNQRRSYYVSKTPSTLYLDLERLISSGDNLVFYLTFNNTNEHESTVTISGGHVTIHDQSQSIALSESFTLPTQTITYAKEQGPWQAELPILKSPLSLDLRDHTYSNLLIEPFHGQCDAREDAQFLQQGLAASLNFTTLDCYDGLFMLLRNLDQKSFPTLFAFAESTNQAGIPLELTLKEKDKDRKHFSVFLPTNEADRVAEQVHTTQAQDYLVEVTSRGIGPIASKNTLNALVIQPIPESWHTLTLVPENALADVPITTMKTLTTSDSAVYIAPTQAQPHLYALPTATSPYWKAVIVTNRPKNLLEAYWQALTNKQTLSLQPTVVNSWQQGWIANENEPGYIVAIFVPNVIAYVGLIFGWVGSIALIARKNGTAHPTKTASTHTPEQSL